MAGAAVAALGVATVSGAGRGVLAAVGAADGSGFALGVAAGEAAAVAVGTGVAGTVGAGVGGALVGGGGAVGTGVGGTVGVGVGCGAWTVMVPVIDAWIAQWYAYVPAFANVIVLLVAPAPITPVSNAPGVLDVAVWAVVSAFDQVMDSPGAMVALGGVNAKLRIVTVWLSPSAAFGSSTAAATMIRAIRMRLFRRIG